MLVKEFVFFFFFFIFSIFFKLFFFFKKINLVDTGFGTVGQKDRGYFAQGYLFIYLFIFKRNNFIII